MTEEEHKLFHDLGTLATKYQCQAMKFEMELEKFRGALATWVLSSDPISRDQKLFEFCKSAGLLSAIEEKFETKASD